MLLSLNLVYSLMNILIEHIFVVGYIVFKAHNAIF